MNRDVAEQVGLPGWWFGCIVTIFAELALTAFLVAIYPFFALGTYPILYILLNMGISYLFGEIPAVLAFFLSLFAFDYFFVPPIHTVWPTGNTLTSWAAHTSYLLGAISGQFATLMVRRSQMRVRQLLRDLWESSRRATNIFESITDAFFALDQNWCFTYVNPTAEQLFERNRGDLLGKNIWEEFPEAVDSPAYEQYHRAVSEGTAIQFETDSRLVHKYVDVRAYPSADGLSVYLHDITERKRAEELLSLLSAIVEFSDDAIISKSLDGIILTWNHGAEKIYNYSPEEVLGKSISILVPPDIPNDVPTILEHIKQGKAVEHYEAKRITKYGRRLDVSLTVSPVRDAKGEIIAASTIARDVTEIVQLRQALERNYALLQRALFPGKPSITDGYEAAAEYVPAYAGQEVGGDFYDVFETANGRTGILIGDVSGKGIEAAALAATTRSTVRAYAYESSCAGAALTRTNAALYSQGAYFGSFVTVFLAILDKETGLMCYSSAGHPPAAVRRKDGRVEFLQIGHPPVGLLEHYQYGDWETRLDTEEKLVLYTDGISEARQGPELFGQEGIGRTIESKGHLPPEALAKEILHDAREWAGGRPADDAAIVVIGRK